MIISHKHKFIFMHSLKTAGSSITVALQPLLSPNDLLSIDRYVFDDFRALDQIPTPFFSEKVAQTLRNEGFTHAAEFMYEVLSARSFKAHPMSTSKFFSAYTKSSLYSHKLRQHAHLIGVKEAYPDAFGRYFKFAVEREPFERLISLYKWRWSERYSKKTQLKEKPSFEEFVMSIGLGKEKRHDYRSFAFSNSQIYSVGNKVEVNRLIDYAELNSGLKEVSEKVGFEDISEKLPTIKSSANKN